MVGELALAFYDQIGKLTCNMPSTRLRVLIADSRPMLAVELEAFVHDLGHLPVEVVHTGGNALTAAARYQARSSHH